MPYAEAVPEVEFEKQDVYVRSVSVNRMGQKQDWAEEEVEL